MTIDVGETIPNTNFFVMGEDGGPKSITTKELFEGKVVVLFGIVGAFTSTCSESHLPGFINNADTLRERGADDIICLSVNDAFVMAAWGVEQKASDKVRMVSDGSASFVTASGLELDLTDFGMGMRCQRFSMIIDDCIVKTIQRENPPTKDVPAADLTSAEHLVDIMLGA